MSLNLTSFLPVMTDAGAILSAQPFILVDHADKPAFIHLLNFSDFATIQRSASLILCSRTLTDVVC